MLLGYRMPHALVAVVITIYLSRYRQCVRGALFLYICIIVCEACS